MPLICRNIMNVMEEWAPARLAASWDNTGLLVGRPDKPVSHVLVALDVSERTVKWAVENQVDMIVSHHPLIFRPLTSLRTDHAQGRTIAALIRADMALFTAHTNLDAASGGVNDTLAAILGLQDVESLAVEWREPLLKLAVFVPASHEEAVRLAIGDAGAGHIGNYSHCTFRSSGVGSFLPMEGTNPFIGSAGNLEQVEEVRLETILPEGKKEAVITAMLAAHPYEEVAYDLYRLENQGAGQGLARIGSLPAAIPLPDFAVHVRKSLGTDFVRVTGSEEALIRRVAVCGGSGAEYISRAKQAGADALVTGDIKYHEAQAAMEIGLAVIDAGHFATERPVTAKVAQYLKDCAVTYDWKLSVSADDSAKDVFSVY